MGFNLNMRRLEAKDYYNGYLQLLEELTVVEADQISYRDFCNRLNELNDDYNVMVVEKDGSVVGSGTLLVEKKFIHRLGNVGHIEDIVVSKDCRGGGLGKTIINHLIDLAKNQNCYKVILNTDDSSIPFYEKCGFTRKETEMTIYF